ncbi:MAG: alanine racemase [Elusimicrobia bacterium]|nr:alanine racemase [Elusimicrobiota bacterium]
MLRPTFCRINLKNLERNYESIRKKNEVIAVVKANAYGHGVIRVAKRLRRLNVKMFAVALIEEGIELRKAGIKTPILIGGSIYPFSNFREVLKHCLTPTIASVESAAALSRRAKTRTAVHIKIDCGMNRIGLKLKNAFGKILAISKMKNIFIEGIYTHFPSADLDISQTLGQARALSVLRRTLAEAGIKPFFHASNTAAIRIPEARFDFIRPGLGLYGMKPYPEYKNVFPVLSFHTKIVFLKTVEKGERISYGGTFRASRRSVIATLPVGYADGVRRELSNRGAVLIRGRRFPIVGRVCMDMIMVDVTGLEKPEIGEDAVLIGRQGNEEISVEEIASLCGTINYEITCGISSRVPRVFV